MRTTLQAFSDAKVHPLYDAKVQASYNANLILISSWDTFSSAFNYSQACGFHLNDNSEDMPAWELGRWLRAPVS